MKNEKMKNQKNLETRSDPNLGKRILKISNTRPIPTPQLENSKSKNVRKFLSVEI